LNTYFCFYHQKLDSKLIYLKVYGVWIVLMSLLNKWKNKWSVLSGSLILLYFKNVFTYFFYYLQELAGIKMVAGPNISKNKNKNIECKS
jgi:hypothetical protein